MTQMKSVTARKGNSGIRAAMAASLLAAVFMVAPPGVATPEDCLGPLQASPSTEDEGGVCVGELYCDDALGCTGGGAARQADANKCGWGSWWHVDGETVSGKGIVHPYLACNDPGGHENNLVDCRIDTSSVTTVSCSSEGDWGSEQPVDCGLYVEEIFETMTVKLRCKDPPLPAKYGMEITMTVLIEAGTLATSTLETVHTILPPLDP